MKLINSFPSLTIGTRPALPNDLPAEMAPMVRFINQLTEFNPSNRPTASSAVQTLAKMLKELTKEKEKGEGNSSPSPQRPSAPHPLTKLVKDYFNVKPLLSSSPKT